MMFLFLSRTYHCTQPEGLKAMQGLVDFYLENAAILRKTFTDMGFTVYGGTNAPYVWVGFAGTVEDERVPHGSFSHRAQVLGRVCGDFRKVQHRDHAWQWVWAGWRGVCARECVWDP